MQLTNEKSKENLLNRLKKIEGQVRGVQNMVGDERDCREIMQQLVAVRSAIHSATMVFLQEYATGCLRETDTEDAASREELVENLVSLFGKLP